LGVVAMVPARGRSPSPARRRNRHEGTAGVHPQVLLEAGNLVEEEDAHLRKHLEKWWACKRCGRCYTGQANLKAHICDY